MAASLKSHVESLPKDLKCLLKDNDSLHIENGKVKCRLSGHEMPCTAAAVSQYLNGKKYKKFVTKTYDYEKLKPHILPSTKKGRDNQLFCMLTMRHLNKIPSHVERHINGRRYKRALARWEECQKSGETFKPYRTRRQQIDDLRADIAKSDGDGETEGEEDGASDVDSLSDLYPAEDFSDNDDNENDVDEDVESERKDGENDKEEDLEDTEIKSRKQNLKLGTSTDKSISSKSLSKKTSNKPLNQDQSLKKLSKPRHDKPKEAKKDFTVSKKAASTKNLGKIQKKTKKKQSFLKHRKTIKKLKNLH